MFSLKKLNQKVNKNLIFVSAGDEEVFASFAAEKLKNHFDICIFFYGKNIQKLQKLKELSTIFIIGYGTKFNNLKKLHEYDKRVLARYESIWICDDDLSDFSGNVSNLLTILSFFDLAAISPAHMPIGKISHSIMRPVDGTHLFRFVNFIEMTCPLFETKALISFLDIYDYSLAGWGIDWWFLNYFSANKKAVFAICDSVVIRNPGDSEKRNSLREIDKFMSANERKSQWMKCLKKYNLSEWEKKNIGFFHHSLN
jgi:hypothetical protein